MTPEDFAAMIAKAVKGEPAPAPAAPPLTLVDVQELLTKSFTDFSRAIDERIEKATTYSREGVGRVGQILPEDSREADPIKYIVKKAADHNTLDTTDKALVAELTLRALRDGMRDSD